MVHLYRFFGCISTQEVWKETEDWQHIDKYMNNVNGYVSMIFAIIDDLDLITMSIIVMVMWMIWWRHNKKMLERADVDSIERY
jgi:hypothetical protein